MKKWIEICKKEDVPLGQVKVFEAAGRRVAVCHVEEGSFYVVDDVCTHDDGPLGEGELFGNAIECPRHGARFDVRSGKVLALPAVTPICTYPIRTEGDAIQVEMSETDAASGAQK